MKSCIRGDSFTHFRKRFFNCRSRRLSQARGSAQRIPLWSIGIPTMGRLRRTMDIPSIPHRFAGSLNKNVGGESYSDSAIVHTVLSLWPPVAGHGQAQEGGRRGREPSRRAAFCGTWKASFPWSNQTLRT